jgi:Spy/CpxP family protein refolding chaperone
MNRMLKNAAVLLLAAGLALSPLASAQDNKVPDSAEIQSIRAAVKADKKALVASTLNLTPAEAKKFWPLYDAYQRSLDAANRRRAVAFETLVTMDKPITDLQARNLAAELIAADEAEIKARRTLTNKLLSKVLPVMPPKKSVRYLQLEGKIRAFQAYDVAVVIPLVK